MYTADEAKEILFNYLNVSQVINLIGHEVVYSDCRPADSDEDVTVGIISISDNNGLNSTQRATCNVNLYVKDLSTEYDTNFQPQPNNARIKTITRALVNIIQGPNDQGIVFDKGMIWLGSVSGTLKIETTKEHYVNIRVEMKLHP